LYVDVGIFGGLPGEIIVEDTMLLQSINHAEMGRKLRTYCTRFSTSYQYLLHDLQSTAAWFENICLPLNVLRFEPGITHL